MTKDFIDELIELVEVNNTIKNFSKERYQAYKTKTFEIAGVEVKNKRILTEEHKLKIAEGKKGKVLSKETKRKMAVAQKGRVHTYETRRKISESNKGRNFSDEHLRRLSEARKIMDWNKPIMTPNGEFISRKALKQKLVDDGVPNAERKIQAWLKLYPNDYYYIKKKKTK
jgi:hypothetical protein